MRKKILILVLAYLSFLVFAQEKTVKIAAASNLSFVLGELKSDFVKTDPEIKLEIIYGSSGNFTTQIEQGAPFDIFMSADMNSPEKLYEKGFTANNPVVYAKGKLIMFSVKKLDLKKGLAILKENNIKSISICNPETAPYGAAAIEALTNYKILKYLESKLVKTETVAQVIQQTITSSDIGFTAESLIFSKNMKPYKEGINWVEVDPGLYKKIEQGIVILKDSKNKPEVWEFYNYILSKKSKSIFIKFSYEM